MKKILIINNGPKPLPPVNGGGVETLVQYILEDCSFNFDITIACMFSKEAEVESRKYPNVKFEYLDFNNCLFKIQSAFYYICNHYWGHDIGNALCNLVRRKVDINKYDIIISENGVRLGYSLRKFFKGKLVLHLHNDWLHKDIQYAEQYKHSYDEIWTISKFLKQRVDDINGAVPVKVLYNGVDTTLFTPCDQKLRVEARNRYGISPNDIVIANCCRIVEEKGVLETVKVFREIQKINPSQHLKLMIIGEISDGNVYHQELMKISNSDIP
ncbi:glycosyltransferase family 4 protein [Prevotella sp.]|uniref:glycosyltransferase family 4 protein n=1 Tax=Prevotella sp. TaxID=59823 RepID=UPI002ABE97F7|nr:glycosyltransferase family 4 protein [Prevotella sp.]